MADRALGLDLLTRVRNIKWGVASIFVGGDEDAFLWYYKRGAAPPFKGLGPQFDNENGTPGSMRASSYGRVFVDASQPRRPTFLMGGHDVATSSTPRFKGIMLVSRDGLIWERVFEEELRAVIQLVWDENVKQFFAWVNYQPFSGETYFECWSSPNGRAWTSIASSAEGNPVFESHCRFGLPDGQFGFDPSEGTNGLLIKAADIGANCLTFSGGVWARGMPAGELETSTDSAQTWKLVGKIPQPEEGGQTDFNTICGGPPGE